MVVEQIAMDVPVALPCRSRSDFLRTLGQLGARPGAGHCRCGAEGRKTRDIHHVYLRCRYDQWVEAFGEPEMIFPKFDAAVRTAIHSWQHPCVDGPVTCIGHMLEDPSGIREVIVVRVSFFSALT
jgi:hypothetical protein